MKATHFFVLCITLLLFSVAAAAQTPQFPIVKGFGGIYEIPDATERPDGTLEYKILVDLTSPSEDPKQISRFVDNVARMMNLHGLAGVTQDRIKVGQSLIARNLKTADLWPGVSVAHSALTTITTYSMKGYTVLKF